MNITKLENIWPFSLSNKWEKEFMVSYCGENKTALSAEDWLQHDNYCKEKFPIKFKAAKTLDSIRWKIEHFIDRYVLFHDLRYYYKNRFVNKTHVLRTEIKPGQWADCDTRLFEGIMLMVVDFIEKEKKHNNWGEYDGLKPWEVVEYEKKQRGEPNQIDGSPYSHDEMPEHQWKAMLAVWEVYEWYKGRYQELIKLDKDLHDSIPLSGASSFAEMLAHKSEEKDEIYKKIWDNESIINKEKKENMLKIVEHVESMWT
jgi:hypothetical protein